MRIDVTGPVNELIVCCVHVEEAPDGYRLHCLTMDASAQFAAPETLVVFVPTVERLSLEVPARVKLTNVTMSVRHLEEPGQGELTAFAEKYPNAVWASFRADAVDVEEGA